MTTTFVTAAEAKTRSDENAAAIRLENLIAAKELIAQHINEAIACGLTYTKLYKVPSHHQAIQEVLENLTQLGYKVKHDAGKHQVTIDW